MSKSPEEAKPLDPPPTEGKDQEKNVCLTKTSSFYMTVLFLVVNCYNQGLQILLMSGVSVTSASQILESFWNIWSQVSKGKKSFSDFPACGPGMYTLSSGIHKVAVAVR